MGIAKTIFSDQGSEFKNNTFQKLLDKHNIQFIFALKHAPFVESFNKTMKNRMMKYMKLKNIDNWAKIMTPVLEAYNNTPHSTTKIRLAGPGDGYWYVERRRGWIWIKLCWWRGDKELQTPLQRATNKVRH